MIDSSGHDGDYSVFDKIVVDVMVTIVVIMVIWADMM